MHYVKHRRIPMRGNESLSEKWVQNLIQDDPALLGFGDIIVKDVGENPSARWTT